MVWHSWAAGLPGNATLDDFYPGDDWVDWVGISVFQQFYPKTTSRNSFSGGTVHDLEHVLQFAARHHKPTMIAESTPFGGIHNNSHIPGPAFASSRSPIWEAWFEPTLRLIQDYDIAMWSYINCNWEVQALWSGVGFGDTRLSIDDTIMDHWHDHVVSSRRFVRATDYELCGNRNTRYDYSYSDDRYYDFDDDHDGHVGDDQFSYRKHHSKHRSGHHHGFAYDDDDDDDDYFKRHGEETALEHKGRPSFGSFLWGEERAERREGMWNSVLPLVMASSSLAIIYFMYTSTRRRRYRRMERTPRAQRVRFAVLDAAEDEGDGSTSLYGSIHSMEEDSLGRERRFVRRVGPNLLLSNTAEGSTLVT